jgi:tRNA1(Val) A37 N6-methylase TrmN6
MSETTTDDILFGELKLNQPVEGPRVSVDTVLLAASVKIRRGERVLELGCAHGAVLLILARKFPQAAKFEGLEICRDLADMAVQNARCNRLEERVGFACGDLREIRTHFPAESFDVVLMNPPYNDPEKSRVSCHSIKAVARHGTACSLADVAAAASHLLKPRGRFYLVMRANRTAEALSLFRQKALEPKRIRFIHPGPGKEASTFLLAAMKQGRGGVVIDPPLFITDEHGEYTPELLSAYRLESPPCL